MTLDPSGDSDASSSLALMYAFCFWYLISKILATEVHMEKKVLLFVKFLVGFCALILKIEVPSLKNDVIERLPLPVYAY